MLPRKLILWTIALLLSLIVIWIVGPHFSLTIKKFLSLRHKIMLSIPLVLIWLSYAFYTVLKNKQLKASTPVNYNVLENTQYLKNIFKQVQKTIKKQNQPWIWLIGPEQSGKTTLIAQNEMDFISPTHKSLKNIEPTQLCDWWISDEVIFIEPASELVLPESCTSPQYSILKNLLGYYFKMRPKYKPTNILLILDIPHLADMDAMQSFTQRLTRTLHLLSSKSSILQITVAITQTDRLLGFTDFFEDLTPEERDQNFGFILTSEQNNNLPDMLRDRFQALITMINQQLIYQLHHQPNLLKRERIIALPAHFEKACNLLTQLLLQLPWNSSIQLQGLYFTSATQKHEAVPLLPKMLEKSSHLLAPNHTYTRSAKCYFVKNFFADLLETAYASAILTPQQVGGRIATVGISIIILLVATTAWHFGYRSSLSAFRDTQSSLQSLQETAATGSVDWMTQMTTFYQMIENLDRFHASYFRWIGLTQMDELKQTIRIQLQTLLTHYFQPYLKATLENRMGVYLNQNNVLELYNALHAYLSMTAGKNDGDFVQQWFVLNWRKELKSNPSQQKYLNTFLNDFMHNSFIKNQWEPDLTLVEKAKNALKGLSLSELAYLEIQEKFLAKNSFIIPQLSSANGIDLNNAMIPAFYSSQNFNEIYDHLIPKMVDHLSDLRGMFGTKLTVSLNIDQKNTLTTEIRKLYLQYYSQTWQDAIANIQIQSPSDLHELQQAILLLIQPKSKLLTITKIALENASLTSTPNGYQALKDFILEKGDYTAVKRNLDALSNYLHPLMQSSHPTKVGYQMALQHFLDSKEQDPLSQLQNSAKNYPEPLRSWINTISASTWHLLLNQSRDYLNTLWQTLILPEYNQKIKGKYPLFKNATEELNVPDFLDFFGPNGTLQTFFQNYLQPFTNISANYWTWLKKDGATIGIPQEDLEMFLRGSLIQQMFFGNGGASPSVHFSIAVNQFSPNINVLSLNVGGQALEISPGDKTIHPLNWPGPNPNITSIRIATQNQQIAAITMTGAWSWFRLLDQSDITPTTNPREFKLTFKIGDSTASFIMMSDSLINPYLPGILNKFRCPENL